MYKYSVKFLKVLNYLQMWLSITETPLVMISDISKFINRTSNFLVQLLSRVWLFVTP